VRNVKIPPLQVAAAYALGAVGFPLWRNRSIAARTIVPEQIVPGPRRRL